MDRGRWRNYRTVAAPTATMVLGYAGTLLLAAAAGVWFDLQPSSPAIDLAGPASLALSGMLTAALGTILFVYGRKHRVASLSRREATLTVALVWIIASSAGALPFWLGLHLSPVDALFEATSGLTTTGATVLNKIEGHSPSLLLWRSLIQWLGGMGIVVLFVAVFPSFGVGGKHMMRGEVPGTTSKGLKPRIRETAYLLWLIYALLTIIVLVTYRLLGMSAFDAICHALTTVSTGGFSTHDDSIGWFGSAAASYACALFMFCASVNYGLYFVAFRTRSARHLFHDPELLAFATIVVLSGLAITASLVLFDRNDFPRALELSFFTVASVVSSTGYAIDDPTTFPAPALAVLFVLMFLGGCSGSTAGGIKIERVVLAWKQAQRQLERFGRPRVVRPLRMGPKAVDENVLDEVGAFLTLFVGSFAAGTVMFSWLEAVPVPTAAGAMVTCFSNMGPGLLHLPGPDTFAAYSDPAKLLGVGAMLLGRLEFFTILALFTRDHWRR